ncbi:ParB/RepB/Spo0J family partition protein [Nitratifractor salsuginis]|uniref:ParB-like partition protein n=1 Tax=Nitratifractor salsuginis (strain DSM 16511 / JCM 12458 / E9I37-1) TaxID=749222 RepID=E6X0C2_NITSE|nr:ParB/RepB/Spo0J family partition protein [Nitratifractor salsuginis]ADV45711.1 parB-like partition protein [Nitratifractor salsuginis DSM 16511]
MALGKGLGAILEEVGQAYESELSEEKIREEDLGDAVRELPVEAIEPNPYQPRKSFDPERLNELAESIRRHGLLQPVVVIPNGEGWILVAGERRLRAHKIIGAEKIRAIIADVDLDRLRMRELALVENIQRENLNPVELAEAYRELLEVHGITHEELASIVHKSRSQITNTLRLLSLSDYAKKQLVEGRLSQGHAKILLSLPEEKQRIVVDTILGRKLSVRETEELVKSNRDRKTEKKSRKREQIGKRDPELEARLARLLPFPHRFTPKGIEIDLPDDAALEALIDLLEKSRR